MFELRQTGDGIYYLYDYIPTRAFGRYSDEEIAISKKMWDYKNGEENALTDFTNDLMRAITILSKQMTGDKIGLVAVPPSKVDKESSIRTSIWNINKWYDKGITKSTFKCDKVIYDYGNLLTRVTDISTAHKGRRATYEEQYDSIECARDRLSRYYTTFIILDDVTTTGTSMEVCQDILVEHGAKERYIYRMAIAKTI